VINIPQSPYNFIKLIKYSRFFVKSRFSKFTVSDEPYFDQESVETFKNFMRKSKFYLEFGSGGSTIFAAGLGCRTISVESDRYFARTVQEKIRNIGNVRIVHGDIGITEEWGYPVFGKPSDNKVKRWLNYIRKPFELFESQKEFPDFVLIDGRFRRSCALEVARRADLTNAVSVIFFDDYADRPHYQSVEAYLGKPSMSGRAAIFSLYPGSLLRSISTSDVFEAHFDTR